MAYKATWKVMQENGATDDEIMQVLQGGSVPQSYLDREAQKAAAASAAQPTYSLPERWFNGMSRMNADSGWVIDSSNSGDWQKVAQLYNSGNTQGAIDLANQLSGSGQFSGYWDDDGKYWGYAQGYSGGANASMQPVIGNQLLTPKGLEAENTNLWLTPDGKVLNSGSNGALTNNGETWGTYKGPQYSGRWFETDAAKAGPTIVDQVAYNLEHYPEGASGLYNNTTQDTSTPYQQVLNSYDSTSAGNYTPTQPQAMSYQEYLNQNGGGKSASLSAPTAYDPNSDTLWQKYLKEYGNAKAPEYSGDPYQAQRDAALAAYGEKWGGSEYQPLRDQYLQNAANMEWNFDPSTDPVWQAYQKQYRREGQRATEDTLGRYAAMTGGMPSTAAVTAASQAGDYYASQLSDKLPEVYQQAYQRYLQEYQRQLGLSDAYAGFDQTEYQRWLQGQQQNLDLANAYNQYGQLDYQKYLDQLGQFNTDRNFAYGAARDNQSLGRQQTEDQYSRYLDALKQANYEDETAYNRYRDTISDQRYDQEWAQQLREYADTQNWKATEWQQYLREYGDKLSQTEKEWAWEQAQQSQEYDLTMAKLAAQYGDYTGLNNMGIDTSTANPKEVAYAADGSMYKFNTPDAQYFVKNAPNGTPGNPTTMTGGDGSIWRKDEYGGITITTKNGKTFTYSNPQIPETKTSGSGYRYTGNGGNGGNGGGDDNELYVDKLIAAGITDADLAYQWLDSHYPKMTVQVKEATVRSLTNKLGTGEQEEKHSLEYGDVVTSLDRMVKRGATWDEIKAEIESEHRDGTISDAEYDQLREKYHSSTDNVENSGRFFDDGRPMSKWFMNTMSSVSMAKANKGIEAARETLYELADKGLLHEYEIDIIMDELGLD